jgi:hypothetical protein
MQEEFFKTADFGTAGYLLACKIPYTRLERNGTQVVFCFPASPEVMTSVGEYTSNRAVPCRDYFHGLRKAKSIIQETIRNEHYGHSGFDRCP